MKINEFNSLAAITDDDFILVWDAESNTTRKIKALDLKAYFATAPISNSINLAYASNGDTNGIFYYIGSLNGGWVNPVTSGEIILTTSSFFDASNGNVATLVNRTDDNGIATQNIANSWVKVDLLARRLKPSYYSVRARQFNANLIRSWKFQASNNNTDWVEIDQKTNQLLSASQWFSSQVTAAQNYRYFRILQTGLSSSGDNILTIGEIEFYGELS
jgi:hypothetical protein